MRRLELKALAKINLGLDVLGKTEDGYHNVRMVMQTVHLHDTVTIEKKESAGIELVSNLYYLPTGSGNLAYRAAELLMREFHIREGVRIALKKHIPVAAGLAGGRSNAAAVLFGVNRLFELGLSKEELMKRGVKLGADVPYCIMRGTALAEGIGEKLSPLPPMPGCIVLIAKPPVSISTKAVYEALDKRQIIRHPDIDGMIAGLEKGNLRRIASCMENVLESVTIPMCPVVQQIKQVMREAGAVNAMMSGSGPSVFGLFKDKAEAKAAQEMIWNKGLAKLVYITGIQNTR